jgi:cytochrome b
MSHDGPVAASPIWDLPTRAIHWLLVLLIPFSWWSAENDHLPWHRLSGYTILGLLLFRLAWGFAGSQTARFADFIKGPRRVFAYVRGGSQDVIGHSPLGGWSVAAMLALLCTQVSLGLFAVDEDALEAGPLSKFVDFDTGRAIAKLHHVAFNVLLALIALHLTAIAFYAIRRRNLVGPMITGRKLLGEETSAPRMSPLWRAGVIAAVVVCLVRFVALGLKF